MREVKTYHFGEVVTVNSFKNGVELSNGIKITDSHEQQCCENVYADWSSLEDTGFENTEFSNLKVELIENLGFRLNGYTVHCYDRQNGYYSGNLSLEISDRNECIIDTINIEGTTQYVAT